MWVYTVNSLTFFSSDLFFFWQVGEGAAAMYDIKSSFDSQGQVSIFPLKSYKETRFLLPSKKSVILP